MELKNSKGIVDRLLVAGSIAIIVAAFYYYYSNPLVASVIRVLILLAGLALSIIVLYQSTTGKELWNFTLAARVELRKIVWPSRQETFQMTLVVVVFTLVMGLFFWLLDMFLLWATRFLTGQGGI